MHRMTVEQQGLLIMAVIGLLNALTAWIVASNHRKINEESKKSDDDRAETKVARKKLLENTEPRRRENDGDKDSE